MGLGEIPCPLLPPPSRVTLSKLVNLPDPVFSPLTENQTFHPNSKYGYSQASGGPCNAVYNLLSYSSYIVQDTRES